MKIAFLIFGLLFFQVSILSAQYKFNLFNNSDKEKEQENNTHISQLRADVQALSSAKFKGRILGTEEIDKAAEYIANRMRELGLQEVDKNYKRIFAYLYGITISPESYLEVNKKLLNMPEEAFPVPFSGSGFIQNYIVANSNEYGNIWVMPAFSNLKESRLSHADKEKIIYKKIQNAKERGAVGVIIYNNLGKNRIFEFNQSTDLPNIGIPVFEVTPHAFDLHLKDVNKLTTIRLDAKSKEQYKQGYNVYGLINNRAKETVIISANYDGYDYKETDEGTLNFSPGANNNASGTAGILFLAKMLKNATKQYNYLIIAYSGTNNGLIGSEKLLNDKNLMRNQIAYAIHLDKIGRVNPDKIVYVSGAGTFVGWRKLFSNPEEPLSYFLENKGIDSSDYQNYYLQKIPYLNFTGGKTKDYGQPSDNLGHINFKSMYQILDKAYRIIMQLEKTPMQFTFIPAIDEALNEKNYSELQDMKVSLGIVPDINYSGNGILIGKVNEGKDADQAGLKKGDVIMQIKNYPIQNYDDYLKVMTIFQKGEKTYIKLKRNGNLIQKVVKFS